MTNKLAMLAGFYVTVLQILLRLVGTCLNCCIGNLMTGRDFLFNGLAIVLIEIAEDGLHLRAMLPLPGDCLQR